MSWGATYLTPSTEAGGIWALFDARRDNRIAGEAVPRVASPRWLPRARRPSP